MVTTIHESAAAAEAVVPLGFPFTRGGYRHVLLARAGRVCLVERTSTRRWSRGAVHYEVVRLKLERERQRDAGRWTDTGRKVSTTLTHSLGAGRLDHRRAGYRGRCLPGGRRGSASAIRDHLQTASGSDRLLAVCPATPKVGDELALSVYPHHLHGRRVPRWSPRRRSG